MEQNSDSYIYHSSILPEIKYVNGNLVFKKVYERSQASKIVKKKFLKLCLGESFGTERKYRIYFVHNPILVGYFRWTVDATLRIF